MTSTDERDELRRTLRNFFARHSAEQDVRRLMEDPDGYDPRVWQVMADQLGLQGLAIAEEYGGSGFGHEELGIVLEEMGAALLCSPFLATVCLVATAVGASGDAVAMNRLLPAIASGELIATLAVSEGAGGWDDSVAGTVAERAGESWHVTGRKRFVLDAHVSGLILAAARTDDGVSLFAVESGSAGLAVEPELTMDQTRRLATVAFDRTPATLIGTSGDGRHSVREALKAGAVALASEQVGTAQRVLDMTVDYVGMRRQFGRPVGSFQAVKHRLAEMLLDLESARSAAFDARRELAEGGAEQDLAVSVAKAVCSDASYRIAAGGLQLHGGIGFTWEHPAHLYFKRATSGRFLFGTPRHHRDLIGRALGI